MLYVSRLGCTGLLLSDSTHSLLTLKTDGHQDAQINSGRSVIDGTRLVRPCDELPLTTLHEADSNLWNLSPEKCHPCKQKVVPQDVNSSKIIDP